MSTSPAGLPGVLLIGNHLSARTSHRAASEELAQHLVEAGHRVIVSSSQPWAPLRLADMLASATLGLGAYQVAVIDVFSGRAFRFAEAVGSWLSLLRRPFILTLHGGGLPDLAQRSPRRLSALLSRAAAVTSPSAFLARELKDFAQVQILPNPIDCTLFAPARPRPSAHTVIWLRAFHAIYRPWDAVEVFATVHRTHPDLRLRMIGPDKNDGSLARVRESIDNHGLSRAIEIQARGIAHREVPAALAWADIFLNTTGVDNTPVSVLEAMAAGVAVVSTDAGGIPDLLEHERTALLSPVGDCPALARSVARLITEPNTLASLQSAARRRAEAFDWRHILPQWQSLLAQVAARSKDQRSAWTSAR